MHWGWNIKETIPGIVMAVMMYYLPHMHHNNPIILCWSAGIFQLLHPESNPGIWLVLSELGGDWALQLVPTTQQVGHFSIETPRQRHVCYLHLPQASASASQRHNLMPEQVPACIHPPAPPLHPLTQPCPVVLLPHCQITRKARKSGLLDLLWSFSPPWLSHPRGHVYPGRVAGWSPTLRICPSIWKPPPGWYYGSQSEQRW